MVSFLLEELLIVFRGRKTTKKKKLGKNIMSPLFACNYELATFHVLRNVYINACGHWFYGLNLDEVDSRCFFWFDIDAYSLFIYFGTIMHYFLKHLNIMIWTMTGLSLPKDFHILCIRLIVSVAWVAHIVIYLLINPPLSAFLNEVFIKLDNIWGKFGIL